MAILKKGFKLFQPWASEIVKGNMKYLVRSMNTKVIGRVAVIATEGLDFIWMLTVSENEIEKIDN
jgi:hypothetical protein